MRCSCAKSSNHFHDCLGLKTRVGCVVFTGVPKVIPAPFDILGSDFDLRVQHDDVVGACPLVVSSTVDEVVTD